jgi:quinolinate synthase
MVHEIFSLEKLLKLKIRHPKAKIISHPECEENILNLSDFIGSTSELLKYSTLNKSEEFIVVTESGILHQMQINNPSKTFIPAPPNNSCACNNCPHMKLNSLEKLYLCMEYELPELILDESLIILSKQPIDRMLQISREHGL